MHRNKRPLCIGLFLLKEIYILNSLFLDIDITIIYNKNKINIFDLGDNYGG